AHDKGLVPHDALKASAGDRPHHEPGEHVGAHDAGDSLDKAGISHAHFEPHESPRSMTLPLIVLAIGSTLTGLTWPPKARPFGADMNIIEKWLEPVVADVRHSVPESAAGAHSASAAAQASAAHDSEEPVHLAEYLLMILSLGIAGAGIALGRRFYVRNP